MLLTRLTNRVVRRLSGTSDILPRALEPWEIQGGSKYAKGATEEEYWLEPEGGGEKRENIMQYIAEGDAVLVDEPWKDCAEMYAGMVVGVMGDLMQGASQKDCENKMKLIKENFLVRYPDPEHFDELEKIAKRGLGRSANRSLSIRKIKNFESWCHQAYPTDAYSQLPVSELVALRDSYRKYIKGVRVLRMDPKSLKRSKRNKRRHLPYIYRPLHNVPMPHHSIVNILYERLVSGRKGTAKRVQRILDINSGAGLSTLLLRRFGFGRQQVVLSDPSPINLLSARWNNAFLSGRKGFMTVPSKNGLFPSVEDCKGNDFQLIVHTVPGTALPVDESVEARCHPGVKEYLLDFLQKADMYLAPNGRIALTCDNFAALNGHNDPLSEVMRGKLLQQHNFEIEAHWVEKTEVLGQTRDLSNPDGLSLLSVENARKKKLTGLRPQSTPRILPPGPLRARAKLEEAEAKILGRPSKNWGPAWSPLMNKLGWQETNKLNRQKYYPERVQEDEERKEELTDGLRTKMFLLKRKTDSDYRLVDFGQRRIGQDLHDELYDDAAHLFDQYADGVPNARSV